MGSDAKEQIRQRLDIAEVIGEAVALRPAGRDQLKGLCPFHSEKTPSFHVHRQRGFFYCFGCQAKGDLFDFVMRQQGLSFPEALELLGRRAGVAVAPATPQERRRRDLVDINAMAHDFYAGMLRDEREGRRARQYLEERGLSEESVAAFGLGYAPDGWDGLLRHALTRGYRDDDLLEAGLLSENESGRRFDRFRNRLIFPIRDPLGRVVGFAGRVLDASLPKYLNTPETPLFRKGELLYGLDRARAAIRERGECIVVEGYMDVIALHQVGIGNAVAALGASLTSEQADQLARLDVQRLFLAFDADAAGQRAVLSGLDQAVGRQFLVSAVRMPSGKDPADAVLEGSVEEFREALRQGLSEVEFRFGAVLERFDAKTVAGQREILNELLPVLRPRSVFDPVAQEMRRLVIDRLSIDPGRLDAWIASQRSGRLNETQVRGLQRSRTRPGQLAGIELEVIALLLLEPQLLRGRLAQLEAELPPLPDSLLREFCALCRECDFDDAELLSRYREREEASVLFERLLQHSEEAPSRAEVEGHVRKALSRLRELHLDEEKEQQRKRIAERMQEVRSLLAAGDLEPGTLEQYYAELRELGAVLAARDAERRMRVPSALSRPKRRGG